MQKRRGVSPRKLLALTFLANLCITAVAFAADKPEHTTTIHFVPEKTSIRWTLADPLHTVRGTFKLKSGVINFNPDDGSADGMIEVDATSGESGNSVRDGRMQKNVLQSDQYQLISFRPTHVTGKPPSSSDQVVLVEGIFRIHGVDHPLQLHVGLHPEGNVVTASAHFVVPYVEWGMKDPSTFILRTGKTVDIDLETTAPQSQ